MILIDKDKLVEALQEANCNECKEKECYSCMMWKIIDAPAVNALTYETIKDALSQIRWERDTALDQLAELGYELGDKIEADVRRVVHGHWVPRCERIREPFGKNYDCSVCGVNNIQYNFCPNCGVDMRGEE